MNAPDNRDRLIHAARDTLSVSIRTLEHGGNLLRRAASMGIAAGGKLAASVKGALAGAPTDDGAPRDDAQADGRSADSARSIPAPDAASPRTERHHDPSEPVNVVEELGLDPAPVDPADSGSRAATSIDAEADAGDVRATPLDVAKAAKSSAQRSPTPADDEQDIP